MEIALSTDYAGEYETKEEIKDCLRRIAEAGFTHIHWCFDWDGDYLYSKGEMQEIRKWMDEYGLKAKALHASKGSRRPTGEWTGTYRKDYTSKDPVSRAAGVELIRNRVELAHIIGAGEIVLHMYLPYEDFEKAPEEKESFYENAFASLDELMPACIEKGVKICIENLYEAPGELQIEEFSRLLDRYPKKFLGLCVDTGHANLVWGVEVTEKLILPFKDRIFALHLHDNSGFGDSHQIPFTCQIKWKQVMQALGQTAYELPLVLEVTKREQEDDKAFLKQALEAGMRLTNLFNEEDI